MMFKTVSTFVFIIISLSLNDYAQCLTLSADRSSYIVGDDTTSIILKCGDNVEIGKDTVLRYKIDGYIIFDWKTAFSDDYVKNLKDGRIQLQIKDYPGYKNGFDKLTCTFGTNNSESIQIHALSDMELRVTPKEFSVGKQFELECCVKIQPNTNVKFTGSMQHKQKNSNKVIVIAKNEYKQDDANNAGTVLIDDVKDKLIITVGEDRSRVYLTAIPISDDARGVYVCAFQIDDVLYEVSNSWDTEYKITTVAPTSTEGSSTEGSTGTTSDSATIKPQNSASSLINNWFAYSLFTIFSLHCFIKM